MRVRTMLLVGLVLTAGLIAAGCGGDDSSTTDETTAVTSEEGTSTEGAISEDEQAALVDGCQQAIDSNSGISSGDADELIAACEDAAANSDSLEDASQAICVETAQIIGGGVVSEEQATEGCKSQLPAP